jgi:hypothetical protein
VAEITNVLPSGYIEGPPPVSGRYDVILRSVGGPWIVRPWRVTFTVTDESAVFVHDLSEFPRITIKARTFGNWRENPNGVAWRKVPHA